MDSYIISVDTFVLMVNGFRIEDWAATGVVCELTKPDPLATHNTAFQSSVWTIGPPRYVLNVNVQQGGKSDQWLTKSEKAFMTLRKTFTISATQGAQPLFEATDGGPLNWPNYAVAADNQPMRAWQLGLSLKGVPDVATFKVAGQLTKQEVQNI